MDGGATMTQPAIPGPFDLHGQVAFVTGAASDLAALRRTVDATAAAHGRLDIVFANAGISGGASIAAPEGRIEAIDLDTWEKVLRINLTSVFATMQAAAAHMKAQRSGGLHGREDAG